MIERRIPLPAARVDPVGENRYSIMCTHCRRSAVVVARTGAAAWLMLAADGWQRQSTRDLNVPVTSCPECAVRAME